MEAKIQVQSEHQQEKNTSSANLYHHRKWKKWRQKVDGGKAKGAITKLHEEFCSQCIQPYQYNNSYENQHYSSTTSYDCHNNNNKKKVKNCQQKTKGKHKKISPEKYYFYALAFLGIFLTVIIPTPCQMMNYSKKSSNSSAIGRSNSHFTSATKRNNEISSTTSNHKKQKQKQHEIKGILSGLGDALTPCYGEYGCYPMRYPWYDSHRIINFIPRAPGVIRPFFFSYTRKNPVKMQLLVTGNLDSVRLSHFDPKKKTYIITHGFLEHGHKDWLQDMKKELLKREDCNVIIIDWLTASGPPYTQATANIRLIGVMSGLFVLFLHKNFQVDMQKLHLVGHSLGAHLCGYTGGYLRHYHKLLIGRITGLDPAQPHFEKTRPEVRLDPSDAFYVDVIHTNSAPITKFGLGLHEPLGHLDFYPNGGKLMQGCSGTFMKSLQHEHGNMAYALRQMLGCNHFRAYEYFIESINTKCDFVGVECPSWDVFQTGSCNGCLTDGDQYGCAPLGIRAFDSYEGKPPSKDHRKLYLFTDEKQPYCSVHYQVTLTLSDTPEALKQGGDRGNFYLILNGKNYSSASLPLSKYEQYYEHGRTYNFMSITRDLGKVKSADLIWEYHSNPLNPLTWRIWSDSKMFVNRIDIEQFGHKHKHTFCAQDKPFFPHKNQTVIWRPTCRDNGKEQSLSLLGQFLNADPASGIRVVSDFLNPLSYNPLNGLRTVGNAISGMSNMGPAMRRAGKAAARMSYAAGSAMRRMGGSFMSRMGNGLRRASMAMRRMASA